MNHKSAIRQQSILIVDDTPANISMLFDLLGEEGYKVLIAEDGESALRQAVKMPPDLVLLDILMPGMDGFSTCRKLKQQAETRDVPIIFMTSITETEKIVKGFRFGAVDYIPKPFQVEEVLARVENHLNLQKLKTKLQQSEQRLTQTIYGAMDSIIAVDEDGIILLFNHAAEQVFQYPAGDMLGQPVNALFTESLNNLFENHIRQNTEHRSAIWIPQGHMAIRRTGHAFPVEATLSFTHADGKALYTLILRDIETRQNAEKQARTLQDINRYFQQQAQTTQDVDGLIGATQGLRDVMTLVHQVAETDATVLVTGETGTGKERVVRALHQLSQRKEMPLITLNCAAIPENLIENELFGHEKGAFTGAVSRNAGRFELANGGTLFLDEIGEMALNLQTKLLRVLQEGQFERVGGTTTLEVDVRIITATHRDLARCVKAGTFREDLYYRLNVFPIAVPSLRERKQDLEALALHFLNTYAGRFGKPVEIIPDRVLQSFQHYHWPGNVRELQHLIERAVILSCGPELAFGDWFQPADGSSETGLISTMQEVEYNHINKVLEMANWRISGKNGAAELLGLNDSTLRSRLKKLGIERHT